VSEHLLPKKNFVGALYWVATQWYFDWRAAASRSAPALPNTEGKRGGDGDTSESAKTNKFTHSHLVLKTSSRMESV